MSVQFQNGKEEAQSISLAQIHDGSLSWIGTGTSIKSGGFKLMLYVQAFPILVK